MKSITRTVTKTTNELELIADMAASWRSEDNKFYKNSDLLFAIASFLDEKNG